MKEAIIKAGPKVEIIDSPIPQPGEHQIVIKVTVSGSNPKDWKYPEWVADSEINQGDDIAGTVHALGPKVTGFKVGDRVGAFHEMLQPNGSYAEYAVAWDHTTFHAPDNVSDEQVATIPLAAMTSVVGLWHHDQLALPAPWTSKKTEKTKTPLLVYGGASAVGAFAIQLARKGGIHPIIAVAGRGQDFVEKLLDKSKGDAVVDYRKGDDAVVEDVKSAVKNAGAGEILHAYDAVSSDETLANIFKIVGKGARITTVLPVEKKEPPKDSDIYVDQTYVGMVHAMEHFTDEDKDFGHVYYKYLARGLEQGWLKPHPTEVVSGGLNGIEPALKNLKDNKASAVKYVFRIADTPGVGK